MTVIVQRRKVCTKCKVLKRLDAFHRYTRSSDGLKSECKDCRADIGRVIRANSTKKCSIPDCGGTHYGLGYCSKHWSRFYRHQDALKLTRNEPQMGKGGPQARRAYVVAYKLDRGCADCGYNKDSRGLGLDHLPGTIKVRDIKSGQQFGWQALLDEIVKCEVVCAICHIIRTSERRKEVMI